MRGSNIPNPAALADINTGWFQKIFAHTPRADVQSAEIIEVRKGTATKIHVRLNYQGEKPSETVWLKTGFEDHSHSIGQDKVYSGEVFYYQNVAGRFDTRTPECLYSSYEADTGRSMIVMKDLLDLGARFMEPVDGMPVDLVRKGLESMVAYQASSWNNDFLTQTSWLQDGGAYVHSDVLGWVYSDANWAEQSQRPRYQRLPEALRNHALLRDTHVHLQNYWWRRSPFCLAHGDAHVGQAYVLPSGEVRFLDWQCVVKAHWAYDYAYFTVSALSITERRQHEKELLRYYLELLQQAGVDAPDFESAWRDYRANVFHGIGWVMCKPEMQGEENCAAIAERFSAALLDLDTIAIVHSEGK